MKTIRLLLLLLMPSYLLIACSNDENIPQLTGIVWKCKGFVNTSEGSLTQIHPKQETTPVYELGALLKQGITTMLLVMSDPGSLSGNLQESYHCFGDPSMEIRTAVPQSFNNVSIIRTTNHISVDLGSESARISFYNTSTGECLCYEGTSAEYNGTSAATIVCIYAHNRIPYVDNPVYYIQNETITGIRNYSAGSIIVGSDVTDSKPNGEVILGQGNITLSAEYVEIKNSTAVPLGTTLTIGN